MASSEHNFTKVLHRKHMQEREGIPHIGCGRATRARAKKEAIKQSCESSMMSKIIEVCVSVKIEIKSKREKVDTDVQG